MRRPFLATYIVQHGGNVRFVPKSRHSGRYWILLLVGKGTQVRGSSPVKLTRRRFLHLTVGAAAIPAFSRTASAETYPTRPAIGHNCGPPMDELPATPGQDLRGMPRDLSCYYGCLPARQFDMAA
jgi:hypothetical protein